MNDSHKIVEIDLLAETLESEVKGFAEGLNSSWAKYLAEKILSGTPILEQDIDKAYSYLLEEFNLNAPTERPEIKIAFNDKQLSNYKADLLFAKLENVEGVNALSDNQIMEFCQNVTIIYGANGSGKSGYVRLLKKAFNSKPREEIVPNIHLVNGHKSINAKFIYNSENKDFF